MNIIGQWLSVNDIGSHSTLLERFHSEDETHPNGSEEGNVRCVNDEYTSDEEGSSIFRRYEEFKGIQEKNVVIAGQNTHIAEGEGGGNQVSIHREMSENLYVDDELNGQDVVHRTDGLVSMHAKVKNRDIEQFSIIVDRDYHISDISLCLVLDENNDNDVVRNGKDFNDGNKGNKCENKAESFDEYLVGHGVDIIGEKDVGAVNTDTMEEDLEDNSSDTLQESISTCTLQISQLSAISICTITNHHLIQNNEDHNIGTEVIPIEENLPCTGAKVSVVGLGDSLYSDCGVPL